MKRLPKDIALPLGLTLATLIIQLSCGGVGGAVVKQLERQAPYADM
jgi:hypothetical protein